MESTSIQLTLDNEFRMGFNNRRLYTCAAAVIVSDMTKERIFENTETLISAIESLLRDTMAAPGNLMLSGGSTPYAVYNRFAESPCPVHPARKIFLSDERMQPLDSDRNNAYNLMSMLKALDCEDRFIRVDTRLPVEKAAQEFESSLQSMENVDLGLLGMGTDGHTAGFFALEQASLKTGPLTLYTDRPDGMQGVTVSPAFIHRVERIIVLVSGESKRNIIHTLLTRPETIAAGIALIGHPNTEIWTDIHVSAA